MRRLLGRKRETVEQAVSVESGEEEERERKKEEEELGWVGEWCRVAEVSSAGAGLEGVGGVVGSLSVGDLAGVELLGTEGRLDLTLTEHPRRLACEMEGTGSSGRTQRLRGRYCRGRESLKYGILKDPRRFEVKS